jgi:hypothetical protein
LVIDARR